MGGKGAELAEMTSLGVPVPPSFTVTTQACKVYYDSNKRLPDTAWSEVLEAVSSLEAETGKIFGNPSNPLLVSVRSGAAVSMPGMMDTVLNLGMTEEIANGIAIQTGNERFALDLYRRFVQMYGNVVLGVPVDFFEDVINEHRVLAGDLLNSQLPPKALRSIISKFTELIEESAGTGIPSDPKLQLKLAIQAVFDSWNSRRATDYRNYHGIDHDLGTAVSVVAMVYGNRGCQSCTGVIFTRDPSTGENRTYGEFLVNAQGEDVVSGFMTPRDISDMKSEMPAVYKELIDVGSRLESHYKDAQDIEFTVEEGKLYILQTRSAKRSVQASVKIAVDMVDEGLIKVEDALLSIDPNQIYQLLLPSLEEEAKKQAKSDQRLIATGLGASPGGASGKVVFHPDLAKTMAQAGETVILVRPETSPDDVHGMLASAGILTSRGGTTSHAAVVARGLGKPCVTGAADIEVNPADGYLTCNNITVHQGEEISIDGLSGEVFRGVLTSVTPSISSQLELTKLLSWADDVRTLQIWANADYPKDAQTAIELGAEGIGLCRTEHMFFEPERLTLMRDMIVYAHLSSNKSNDTLTRENYFNTINQLQLFQSNDFENIFKVMQGKPVVIRLLDPPLHEFLPNRDEILEEVIKLRFEGDDSALLSEKEKLLSVLDEMRESNPMLGLRGCRLGIRYFEIYAMQVRAIMAAVLKTQAQGISVRPEIMIPLVGHRNEMRYMRDQLKTTIEDYLGDGINHVYYKIGTMIEIPRAALTADEIAEFAEFFSFGTNDLTQTTFGYSRDDAEGKFLTTYKENGIISQDPFEILDRRGVGQLISIAARLGKETRPDIVLGICGEHGGDSSSIEFCHAVGLDYVSCSPYRVPIARIAAARAALLADRHYSLIPISDGPGAGV